MNTIQIEKILSRNNITKKYFLGCFPSDKIPTSCHFYPFGIIVNNDTSFLEGSHWVAIWIKSNNSAEYYDSFGDWPSFSKEISDFLKTFSSVRYNRLQLQSNRSSSCGKHAIYFIYKKCQNKTFDWIIESLKYSKINADRLVSLFTYRLQANI